MKRNTISGFLAATMLFASGSLLAAPALPLGPGMLGFAHPALVDTDGDGMPSAGDTPIGLSFADPNLMLSYPSTCGTPLITFGNMVGGQYQMATMFRGSKTDIMSITSTSARPTDWSLMEGSHSGIGGVMDRNGDGVFDAIHGQMTGGGFSFDIGHVYQSVTGHSYGDYVSIPWSQASLLGVGGPCKVGGVDPQVFIPMADTNGDGVPDSIVFDFAGGGTATPGFAQGPIISGPNQPLAGVGLGNAQIPTLSQWAILVATLALAGVGWLQLKKGPAIF